MSRFDPVEEEPSYVALLEHGYRSTIAVVTVVGILALGLLASHFLLHQG